MSRSTRGSIRTNATPHTAIRSAAALGLALVLTCLAACNAKDPSQPKPPTPQAGGAIPQAQLDALGQAKGVEATLQQGAQRSTATE